MTGTATIERTAEMRAGDEIALGGETLTLWAQAPRAAAWWAVTPDGAARLVESRKSRWTAVRAAIRFFKPGDRVQVPGDYTRPRIGTVTGTYYRGGTDDDAQIYIRFAATTSPTTTAPATSCRSAENPGRLPDETKEPEMPDPLKWRRAAPQDYRATLPDGAVARVSGWFVDDRGHEGDHGVLTGWQWTAEVNGQFVMAQPAPLPRMRDAKDAVQQHLERVAASKTAALAGPVRAFHVRQRIARVCGNGFYKVQLGSADNGSQTICGEAPTDSDIGWGDFTRATRRTDWAWTHASGQRWDLCGDCRTAMNERPRDSKGGRR